jgi:hypothetical protein
MFFLRFEKLSVAKPGNNGIFLDFSIQNRASRIATIMSQVYELWQVRGTDASRVEFMSPLTLDLHQVATQQPVYQPEEQRPLRLVWHVTPQQLQRVEDLRQGEQPIFQIMSRLSVNFQWFNTDRTPHAGPVFVEESIFDGQSNSYPVVLKVDRDSWVRLLNEIGFRNIILHELPLLEFPPGFARAEKHLSEAWDHFRAGRNDGALQCCYKAFECLGFNVCGDKVERAKLLSRLLDGEEETKRKVVESLWAALHGFFHLGRHESGKPMKLSQRDGELAVVSATVLLRYLASEMSSHDAT